MEMSTCVEVTYPPSPQVQCLFPAERLLREISACDMCFSGNTTLSPPCCTWIIRQSTGDPWLPSDTVHHHKTGPERLVQAPNGFTFSPQPIEQRWIQGYCRAKGGNPFRLWGK
ncbi:uncharacterized [Tachysurus ichikawai]